MNTTTICRTLSAALCLALLSTSCTKSEPIVVPDTGAPGGSGGGTPAEASFDAALEAEPIPSQDVADAAAEQEITEANADAEFAALKAQIEADG
jgi:hypothetical protein